MANATLANPRVEIQSNTIHPLPLGEPPRSEASLATSVVINPTTGNRIDYAIENRTYVAKPDSKPIRPKKRFVTHPREKLTHLSIPQRDNERWQTINESQESYKNHSAKQEQAPVNPKNSVQFVQIFGGTSRELGTGLKTLSWVNSVLGMANSFKQLTVLGDCSSRRHFYFGSRMAVKLFRVKLKGNPIR